MAYYFGYLRNFPQMIRYTIKLTKSEVEKLKAIINKGSHTSQTSRMHTFF